jgi:hypothetical protein
MDGTPHQRRYAVKRLIVLALLLPVLGGCFLSGKDPVGPDRIRHPPASQYLVASTPQAVLNNLIKSYTERDSTHYRQCYDLSYMGQTYDGLDEPGSQPASYSYDDEANHIAALQRSTTIYHVLLVLPNYQAARMDTFPADPPGVVSMSIYNPQVQIDDASGSIGIASGEAFLFKFIPEAVSTTVSPTGKLWKIYAWAEIAPGSP